MLAVVQISFFQDVVCHELIGPVHEAVVRARTKPNSVVQSADVDDTTKEAAIYRVKASLEWHRISQSHHTR